MAVTRSVAVPGQSHGHDGNTFPELTLADIVATSRIAVLPGRAILEVSCVHNCARVWGYLSRPEERVLFFLPSLSPSPRLRLPLARTVRRGIALCTEQDPRSVVAWLVSG